MSVNGIHGLQALRQQCVENKISVFKNIGGRKFADVGQEAFF
jgi:hypothetical protein